MSVQSFKEVVHPGQSKCCHWNTCGGSQCGVTSFGVKYGEIDVWGVTSDIRTHEALSIALPVIGAVIGLVGGPAGMALLGAGSFTAGAILAVGSSVAAFAVGDVGGEVAKTRLEALKSGNDRIGNFDAVLKIRNGGVVWIDGNGVSGCWTGPCRSPSVNNDGSFGSTQCGDYQANVVASASVTTDANAGVSAGISFGPWAELFASVNAALSAASPAANIPVSGFNGGLTVSKDVAASGHTLHLGWPNGAPTVLGAWEQCGGRGGRCGPGARGACTDAAWSGLSCPSGYTCQRDNAWWWACKPGASSSGRVVGGSSQLAPGAVPCTTLNAAVDSTGACRCVAPNVYVGGAACCAPGGVYSATQKKCVCPSGTVWSAANGRCVRQLADGVAVPCSAKNAAWNGAQCYCPSTTRYVSGAACCSPGGVWNATSGACACPPNTVWSSSLSRCVESGATVVPCSTVNAAWDGDNCLCKPPNVYVGGRACCAPGGVWSAAENKCVCPAGTAWSEARNRCVQPPAGVAFVPCTTLNAAWDGSSCTCRSPNVFVGGKACCAPGGVYDAAQNKCACPPGTLWSETKKQCYASTDRVVPCTTLNAAWDGSQCLCRAPNAYVGGKACCSPGGVYDAAQNKCVCPPGTLWSDAKKECYVSNSTVVPCSTLNAAWDGTQCLCVYPNGFVGGRACCSQGGVYDAGQNKCACDVGLTWNETQKRCI